MPTFLLTWNPDEWQWDDLPRQAATVQAGESVEDRWSTGNRKSGIDSRDRFYLLCQGVEPRGIIALGRIESGLFQAPHYKPERAQRGDEAGYADIRFETLIDSESQPSPVLEVEVLKQAFPGVGLWRTQSSGVRNPPDVASHRQDLWDNHFEKAAEEVRRPERFVEGGVHTMAVNAYEHNEVARRACIEHWGACGFDSGKTYGEVGVSLS